MSKKQKTRKIGRDSKTGKFIPAKKQKGITVPPPPTKPQPKKEKK